MLGIGQIDIHENGQDGNAQDIQKIAVSCNYGKPAGFGGLIDDTNLS